MEQDFHNKCYLCESSNRNLQIEHLRPQSASPEHRSEWTNLLLACGGSCNQRRIHWESPANGGHSKRWPPGGMLDPGSDSDVEQRLQQSLVFVDDTAVVVVEFQAVDSGDVQAVNTAQELNRIHDDSVQGRKLRQAICTWMNRIIRLVADVAAGKSNDARLMLKNMLGYHAPYAGLARAYIRARYERNPELLLSLGL